MDLVRAKARSKRVTLLQALRIPDRCRVMRGTLQGTTVWPIAQRTSCLLPKVKIFNAGQQVGTLRVSEVAIVAGNGVSLVRLYGIQFSLSYIGVFKMISLHSRT